MSKKVEEKGDFSPIKKSSVKQARKLLKSFSDYKAKNVGIMSQSKLFDAMQNEIIADEIGFNNSNHSKHGWDCMLSEDGHRLFLEVKNVDMDSGVKIANFNDITIEKANAFGKDDVCLALSLWESGEPMCIVFGKTSNGLSQHLLNITEGRSKESKNPRNTIVVTPFKFVDEFGFKILTKQKPEDVVEKLCSFDGRFGDKKDDIVSLSDFNIAEYVS